MTAPDIALEPAPEPVGFVVVLPEPPSDNDLHMPVLRWKVRKYGQPGKAYARMICSPEYDAWKLEAGHKLNRQETQRIPGRVSIDICITEEGGPDTTNVIKAVPDLLVSHNLIDQDTRKQVRHCAVDVFPVMKGWLEPGEMQVRVRGLPAET